MTMQQPDKFQQAISAILEAKDESATNERLERIEQKVDLLLSVLCISQKELAQLLGISNQTINNKIKIGELEKLQSDGSRFNFFTLKAANNLKVRGKKK